ncbi:MAG: hypothetical protein KGI54_04045 [Pseudomonadota bacterium]|nr:hypothetical protein [Pseudomonadota bacterium]
MTRKAIIALFENELSIPRNATCEKCDAKLKHPLLPWLIGPKFSSTTEKVLFVGKPHRGTPVEVPPSSNIIDPVNVVSEYWRQPWPYWRYTREIAEVLYGDSAKDSIAMTNLIKCTNVEDGEPSTDETTPVMAESCILKLGVFWKEVELIKPKTLVFYTYSLFPEMLEEVPVAFEGTVQEITSRDNWVMCRNKKLGWWDRICKTAWTDNLRLLVAGHPERMGKPEYVKLISDWVRSY